MKIIKTLSLFSVVPFWIFACDDLRIWSWLALICIQSPWMLPCDGNYILKTDALSVLGLAVDKLLKTTLLWKTVRTCEGSKCDREQFSCCF